MSFQAKVKHHVFLFSLLNIDDSSSDSEPAVKETPKTSEYVKCEAQGSVVSSTDVKRLVKSTYFGGSEQEPEVIEECKDITVR